MSKRRAVSPYARRLARERGISLADLAGSGPNGRVVAADVPATAAGPAPTAEIAAAPAPLAPMPSPMAAIGRSIGAFSASVELGALTALIEAAGGGVPLDPFLIKAAAHAIGGLAQAVRYIAEDGTASDIPSAADLSPTAIARAMEAGASGGEGRPLVLSRLRYSGIRPVSGALPVDADFRMLIAAGKGASVAEALLIHDAAAIPEAAAARILADFRDAIENPLQLLV